MLRALFWLLRLHVYIGSSLRSGRQALLDIQSDVNLTRSSFLEIRFKAILLTIFRRLVHDTDIVELELKSKRFNLTVRKQGAVPEPQIQVCLHSLP